MEHPEIESNYFGIPTDFSGFQGLTCIRCNNLILGVTCVPINYVSISVILSIRSKFYFRALKIWNACPGFLDRSRNPKISGPEFLRILGAHMHSRFLAKKLECMWGPAFLRILGAHMHSRFLAKKRGGFPQDGFADQFHFHRHVVQFLQKKRWTKKKGEERICGADRFSGTNIDNEIERKGVSAMEYQLLYPRAAPIFERYLLLEMPKLVQKVGFRISRIVPESVEYRLSRRKDFTKTQL